MTDSNYQRWTELVDREAVGDPLSKADQQFCREFAKNNPICRQELEFWEELEHIDTDFPDKNHDLVNSVLEKIKQEADQQADLADSEPYFIKSRLRISGIAAASVFVASIAAALLLWVKESTPDSKQATIVTEPHFPRVELVFASGQVLVNHQSVKVGELLLTQGDEIIVQDGQACLVMDPGINVCQGENSHIKITDVTPINKEISLVSGRVTAALAPQPKNSKFSVTVGETSVTAIGTVFAVEVTTPLQKEVETTVLAGKVSVRQRSNKHIVRAHQRMVVDHQKSQLSSIVRADEARHWALVQNTSLWEGPASSVLDLCSAPFGATVVLDGRPIGAAPLSSLIPVGTHHIKLQINGQTVLERPFASKAGKIALKSIDLKSAIRSFLSESEDQVIAEVGPNAQKEESSRNSRHPSQWASNIAAGQLIKAARRLRLQSRWEEAAFAYRELRQVYPYSPEAHTILVPLGQLELFHLNQPQQALKNLNLYLQQGGGSLAQEARHARIKALEKLGKRDDETYAIEEFLEYYPSSFESKVLRKRLEILTGETSL